MSLPSAEKLKQYISRLENLEIQKADLAQAISEVFAESKNEGFDPKIMRQILKIRKMEPQEREEQEELLELYLKALT